MLSGSGRDPRDQMGSMGMGAQTATVSPLAKYKLVFLGDQSVGEFAFPALEGSCRMLGIFHRRMMIFAYSARR